MQIIKRHIAPLDGLRGVAVLIVMVYHFITIPLLSQTWYDLALRNFFLTGWLGVDIFFALSGFLITSILLETKQSPTFYRSFYIKRFLRIFPLYYLYLAFIFFVFFPLIFNKITGPEQQNLVIAQHSEIYYWLYISNIKEFFEQRFGGAALGHVWSLAIEEQFYLLWPFIIYNFSNAWLKKILPGIMGLAILFRIICCIQHVQLLSVYTFTFTRMDALAYGAFVALLVQTPLKISYKKISTYFKIALFVTVVFFLFFGPYPNSTNVMTIVGYSLIGITNALLILVLQGTGPSRLKVFFSNRLLRFFGKYSYALYIFNPLVRQICYRVLKHPVLIGGSQIIWDISFIILCTLISTLIAFLSWHLFEKWFMKIKRRYEQKQLAGLNKANIAVH